LTMLRSTRPLLRGFGWERAVSPFNKNSSVHFREIDNRLDSMWKEANSIPTKMEPIDWDAYRKLIKEPGVVDALQKEYEAKTYPVLAPTNKEAVAAHFARLTKGSLALKAFAEKHLVRLKKDLADVELERVDRPFWTLEDYYEAMPGIQEQLVTELEDCQWMLDAESEKLANYNPAPMIQSLKDGVIPEFPEELSLIPQKLGSVDYKAQREAFQKEFDELEKAFQK